MKKHQKKIVVEKERKMRNEEVRNWAMSNDYAQVESRHPRQGYLTSRASLTPDSFLCTLLFFGGEFRVFGAVAARWLCV